MRRTSHTATAPLTGSHPQSGFSLVELMIALLIGLLLLAGVLQILLSNRNSFDAQRGRAHLQENARLASYVLDNTVAHAGFYTELTSDRSRLFDATGNADGNFQAGAYVSGEANSNKQSDTLRVRFQAKGGVHDCLGSEVGDDATTDMAIIEFYVNASDTLLCRDLTSSAVPQPIAENVDRFEVRYGLASSSDPSVVRYVSNLTSVDASLVRSVRVQLLLRNSNNAKPLPTPIKPDFTFSDRSNTSAMPADQLGRLMLDQTIALRNTLP